MTATASLLEKISGVQRFEVLGRVTQVVGLVIESLGPSSRIGDVCVIETENDAPVHCEVVGFRGGRILMMPLGEITGVKSGSLVKSTGHCVRVPVGEGLLGRCVDGLGRPIDNLGPLDCHAFYPNIAPPPNAMSRQMIESKFETGVKAIDSCLTMGIGQRVGIFAGSGVGKSTLLGMIARGGEADVNVIALVGERGREVREFIANDLGPEGMAKSIVVCATSDEPALLRIKAALTATAIAEYFRDQGLNVMLMMDSVTRFAMAQREVGLAIGEPPSTKGYTPSVFALLPKLMERAGCGPKGAITGIYTVLVDGDDTNEPIADATRGILDGHFVLDRKLTSRGHYPPINVMDSLSRVMPMVTDEESVRAANKLRELVAAYYDVEDLVSVGAYKPGTQPLSDKAIDRWDRINQLLRQARHESFSFEQSQLALRKITDD
ncbi:FliI/YscN family ATPase [Kamptonema cortianum]|nr:FliI/YscN family ATPase [Geitlerinema splendidum]MDK3158345.1 FliI/YscN family ATPase [Kamptonema cortianum]